MARVRYRGHRPGDKRVSKMCCESTLQDEDRNPHNVCFLFKDVHNSPVHSRVIAVPHLEHLRAKQGISNCWVALKPHFGQTQYSAGPAMKTPSRSRPPTVPGPWLLGLVMFFIGISMTSCFVLISSYFDILTLVCGNGLCVFIKY